MSNERFWMVCRKPVHPNSKTEPKNRYAHKDAALNDARRLASQTGADFVVLGVEEVVRPTDSLTGSFNF